jgi:hypothetical protein
MALAPITGSLAASTTERVEITSTPLPVQHVIIKTMKPYSEVKAGIEKLGRLDDSIRALLTKNDIEVLQTALKRIAGEDGLAIHYVALHGDLLALKGERRPLTSYYIGNVLSAVEMTKVNPAPVSMRRYEWSCTLTWKAAPRWNMTGQARCLGNSRIRRSMPWHNRSISD